MSTERVIGNSTYSAQENSLSHSRNGKKEEELTPFDQIGTKEFRETGHPAQMMTYIDSLKTMKIEVLGARNVFEEGFDANKTPIKKWKAKLKIVDSENPISTEEHPTYLYTELKRNSENEVYVSIPMPRSTFLEVVLTDKKK